MRLLPACALCLVLATPALAEQPVPADQAGPDSPVAWPSSTSPVPVPLSEQALPTMLATPWYQVSSEGHTLEGAIADDKGNLYFCDVSKREVLRLDAHRQVHVLTRFDTVAPGGLALHRDGRLFIASINLDNNRGTIHALSPDGSLETIVGADKGYLPNDLVLDSHGGLYFTDFRGSATDPSGGVYYVSPDRKTITPVLKGLAQANGIGLSQDGRTLWITEFARGQLYRVELATPTRPTPIGTSITHRFAGPAPDSLRVDLKGNVYVAVYGQGRVLVFSPLGTPIGQILLPGRDKGTNLLCTSLALVPGSDDLYIVSGNLPIGAGGAHVFQARAMGRGLPATR